MKVLDNLQVPVRGQETEKTQTELSELFLAEVGDTERGECGGKLHLDQGRNFRLCEDTDILGDQGREGNQVWTGARSRRIRERNTEVS